jgi:hypothetical protein
LQVIGRPPQSQSAAGDRNQTGTPTEQEPHVNPHQRKLHADLKALGDQRTPDQDHLFAVLEDMRLDEDAAWEKQKAFRRAELFAA